ncbi:hypothetical protein Y032_0164g3527 [Ancylostoma ceylanicum]|uniref:Uncharacterized protein n=1 Tax=Ancylostoma ceylanicum TaxID=53326 RepID=A0A016SXK8_9BILA|nr:hypothetical protein Y032_0164g3527 [Ancylostoma ceylanicum]
MWDFTWKRVRLSSQITHQEIGVIDDLRWEVMVIGTVEHRSAGCARNCAFTEKEPVHALLATTMNSNHEQTVLSRTFPGNDEFIVCVSPAARYCPPRVLGHTGKVGVTKNSQFGFEL